MFSIIHSHRLLLALPSLLTIPTTLILRQNPASLVRSCNKIRITTNVANVIVIYLPFFIKRWTSHEKHLNIASHNLYIDLWKINTTMLCVVRKHLRFPPFLLAYATRGLRTQMCSALTFWQTRFVCTGCTQRSTVTRLDYRYVKTFCVHVLCMSRRPEIEHR